MRDNDSVILESIYSNVLLKEYGEDIPSMVKDGFPSTVKSGGAGIKPKQNKDPFKLSRFQELQHSMDIERMYDDPNRGSSAKDIKAMEFMDHDVLNVPYDGSSPQMIENTLLSNILRQKSFEGSEEEWLRFYTNRIVSGEYYNKGTVGDHYGKYIKQKGSSYWNELVSKMNTLYDKFHPEKKTQIVSNQTTSPSSEIEKWIIGLSNQSPISSVQSQKGSDWFLSSLSRLEENEKKRLLDLFIRTIQGSKMNTQGYMYKQTYSNQSDLFGYLKRIVDSYPKKQNSFTI